MSDAEIQVEIGRRLEECRVRARLELTQAAQRTGLSRRTIYRAELGDNPTLSTLLRLFRLHGRIGELDGLLRAAEVSPMALLRGKAEKPLRKRRRRGRDGTEAPHPPKSKPRTDPR